MNKKNIPKYFPGLFFPALVLLLLTITINVPTAFAAASEEEISAFEKLRSTCSRTVSIRINQLTPTTSLKR